MLGVLVEDVGVPAVSLALEDTGVVAWFVAEASVGASVAEGLLKDIGVVGVEDEGP